MAGGDGEMPAARTPGDDLDFYAHELAVDAALVAVQRGFPYESWRGAELRELLELALAGRRPGQRRRR